LTYTVSFTLAAANTDNTLSNLKVDDVTIDGFNPATLAYFMELSVGTTTVPTVTATTNHATAGMVISQAENVTGTQPERTASVIVTSQGGVSNTYTVEFSVLAPGADATLSDLKVDGNTLADFSPQTTSYTVSLAANTTVVPDITVTTTDDMATAVVAPATNLTGDAAERTTTVVVTAQNTTTTKTYLVIFYVKSDDATLSDLTYNLTQVPLFDPATFD
jgi:hypothetical protein